MASLRARALALVSAIRIRCGAIVRFTFCGEASPMPANLPSSVRITAFTIATSPFSFAGTCKSSVSMLLSPRLCASSRRPAWCGGLRAAVNQAEFREPGGPVVAGRVVETESGCEGRVGDGACVVDRLQRLDQMVWHTADYARLGPDLIDPDHGQRSLPQRGLDVLQEIPVLLDQNQMLVPILPARRPRRQYPKRLVRERVVHELDPTRVHIQDATLRQSLQRSFERLTNRTARPTGHHQLATEVAPSNLEDLVRPLLNHRSCPHCRQ